MEVEKQVELSIRIQFYEFTGNNKESNTNEFHRNQARNAAAIFSTASVRRAASLFASVMFFSIVIASVSPGSVVAPYPVITTLASASHIDTI